MTTTLIPSPKSDHVVETVRITKIERHPNADSLSLIEVNGNTVVVRTVDYQVGDLAVYVPVDALVPTVQPEFTFLAKPDKDYHRVRASKLRGIFSCGLLVKARPEFKDGQLVAEELGIQKYVSPSERRLLEHGARVGNGRSTRKVHDPMPRYGLDNAKKYGHVLQTGEVVVITEKIHGCVSPNASITMADGSRRHMKDVMVGEYVLGMNAENVAIASKVLQKFDNGIGDKWLQIRTTNNEAGRGPSYRTFKCTPNHEVFSNGNWVAAGALKVGDKALVHRLDLALNPLQEEVLIGKILGDGSFGSQGRSITWGHEIKQEGYVEWTAQCLGSLVHPSKQFAISGYGSQMSRQRTVASEFIHDLYDRFWVDGRKTVPSDIRLTPISLAFWYMDDGSLSHTEDQIDRAHFATCSFTEQECDYLLEALENLGIDGVKYSAESYWRIRLNADSAERFFLLIAPYIPECMQYKLPERYRGHTPWFPKLEHKPALVPQTILDIKLRCEKSKRMDMETETNNYFCGGILIHNCNARFVYTKGKFYVGSHNTLRGVTKHRIFEWLNQMQLKIRGFFGQKHRATMFEAIGDVWHDVARRYDLKEKLKTKPDFVLYGEIYGKGVQDLVYDAPDDRKFLAFDVFDLKAKKFLDWEDFVIFCNELKIEIVPFVTYLEMAPNTIPVLLEEIDKKNSALNENHLREGFVIKPLFERTDPHVGRVALKLVGQKYLLKAA